jgi:phage tail sheath gpL-like
MATARHLIYVTAPDGEVPVVSGALRPSLQRLATLFKRLASGEKTSAYSLDVRNSGVRASGTITISGADDGTYRATINAVNIDVTGTEDDTTTAALLAAAINASSNALVDDIVTASSSAGVVTITAELPGKSGNTITLATTGTGATASGARLTGGTETKITWSL